MNQSGTNHGDGSGVRMGGVADYFATLGVGDTLVLKHKQKRNGIVDESLPVSELEPTVEPNDTTHSNDDNDDDDVEDDAALLERFYREIVQVSIVSGRADSTTTPTTGSQSQEQHQQEDSTESSSRSSSQQQRHNKNNMGHLNNPSHPMSPSGTLEAVDEQPSSNTTVAEASGFTVLRRTVPAGRASKINVNAQDHNSYPGVGIAPTDSLLSATSSAPGLLSFQDNHNVQSSPPPHQKHHRREPSAGFEQQQLLWSRAQTHHADLHPMTGMWGQFISMLPPSLETQECAAVSSQSNTPLQKQPLRGLGRKVGSTLRDQLKRTQQHPSSREITHTDTSEGQEVELDTKVNSPSYYLAFRRRGADEEEKSAIAQVELYYVRLHKSTILSKTNDSNDDHKNEEGADVISSPKGSKAAAVLKRGLVTGAGLAVRVAGAGKNRIMDKYRNSPSVSAHKTLGRSHFFSDTPPTPTAQSSSIPPRPPSPSIYNQTVASHLITPLQDVVTLPDGFDEWSIPDDAKLLKLPNPDPLVNTVIRPIPSPGMRSNVFFEPQTPVGDGHDTDDKLAQRRIRKTILFPHKSATADRLTGQPRQRHPDSMGENDSQASGMGLEAYLDSDSYMRSSPGSSTASSPTLDSARYRRSPRLQFDVRYSPSLASPREETPSDRGFEHIDHDEDHIKNNPDLYFPSDPNVYMPKLLPRLTPSSTSHRKQDMDLDPNQYEVVPILAIRRQRCGDEERFHEDPAIVDMSMTFLDFEGLPVMPNEDLLLFDEDEEEEDTEGLLAKTPWVSSVAHQDNSRGEMSEPPRTPRGPLMMQQPLGTPTILVRRNTPQGFADAAFATRVLDRFPTKNYKGFPLPEEELPMFCYPTGCRLRRALFQDAPLAECYGFVVKNERGDSIHVSCVSFMEPLTSAKINQLNRMSERRRRTSLPSRFFCERRDQRAATVKQRNKRNLQRKIDTDISSDEEDSLRDDLLLTGFDEMTTFENKTICLISRYPYWTAFRRFLSHLHILSGSSSHLPLERCISHLLLTVPVPKPGAQCVIVPLPTLSGPMVLAMPPVKDLPLLDLTFERLFACLDVPTVVTVVLGFLALERKVIVMSTHPSLVLDGCELLRCLLFPFDLCAPYVPRLTQPFMSCLDFPGAIFVGIHDDGTEDGLAATVRRNMPEDSAIVDLDTGEIDCSGDRFEVLKQCWGVIPTAARSALVSEIETLCRDAGLAPGQEPLESQIDSAFDASVPSTLVEDYNDKGYQNREPLDDRAVRDTFLRFFCAVLCGYERFLVVPDMDFLISGNEWFDSQGFLAAAPPDRSAYIGSLVTTQLFQSFIQRRTEASDVHCMLFDECLAEYHSSSVPYGRHGGDVETTILEGGVNQPVFSLLVDQCATEIQQYSEIDRSSKTGPISVDGSETETNVTTDLGMMLNRSDFFDNASKGGMTSMSTSLTSLHLGEGYIITNSTGDLVTMPSVEHISPGSRFVYCVDGNPCFPHKLDANLFYPAEPEILTSELASTNIPVLTRSDQEVEESNRRRKMSTSHRGLRGQRRCLWQLPKLMGSHVLGAWLMCVPPQVSQAHLAPEQQTKYLLRALGALRLMRNKQRIVADEAAYRCLMVACGRTGSDRRVELVKIFGFLRSDGIFPSAVTLGQYTRAIAEGFSKRSSGMPDDENNDVNGVEVTVSASRESRTGACRDFESALVSLDSELSLLEDSGRRWRNRQTTRDPIDDRRKQSRDNADDSAPRGQQSTPKKSLKKTWMPVSFSSSFPPLLSRGNSTKANNQSCLGAMVEANVRFVALWSRTTACQNCSYTPLDEEIMCGWDVVGGELEIPNAVACPRCDYLLVPRIGFKDMSLEDALGIERDSGQTPNAAAEESHLNDTESFQRRKLYGHTDAFSPTASSIASFATASDAFYSHNVANRPLQSDTGTTIKQSLVREKDAHDPLKVDDADFAQLPPQIRPCRASDGHIGSGNSPSKLLENNMEGYVTYLSPSAMRSSLERHVQEHGEEVLERETLRKLDPEVFYNLWWFCARFSLPLPLSIGPLELHSECSSPKHYCAYAGWDESVVLHGCESGAKVVLDLLNKYEYGNNKEGLINQNIMPSDMHPTSGISAMDDFPLLSQFNLQAYCKMDWDHPDLSKVLVTLVDACDKKDFRPVIECLLDCNKARRETFAGLEIRNAHTHETDIVSTAMDLSIVASEMNGSIGTSLVELDCYRTILYLAKYQCTSAFHTFFPAAVKSCKGYHFWCIIGTPLPIFDRLFRDAVKQLRSKDKSIIPIHDISDVALAFRCVFGHII